MAIDVINNLSTKPKQINNRDAQTATQGAEKLVQQKAGSQGAVQSTGKVNVMGNLGVQQQEQQAANTVNQADKVNRDLQQNQANMQADVENQERLMNEQELAIQNAYDQQVTALMDNMRQQQASLEGQINSVGLESLAQTLRQQDQLYIDKLRTTMEKDLLRKGISEAEMTEKLAFGDEFERLKEQSEWNIEFEKERLDREFMDSKEALQQAFRNGQALARSRDLSRTIGGVGSILETGGQVYKGMRDSSRAADAAQRQKFEDDRSGYTDWLANQKKD